MKKVVEKTPYCSLPTCLALAFLLFLCPALHGQNQEQELLLKEAYSRNSEYDLYRFFDNWSKEVTSNETEAPDKWVAEAHKVFVAFYKPLLCGENGFQNEERPLYKDNPYFIVQNTLRSIYVADTIPYKNDELIGYYTSHIDKIISDESYRRKYIKDEKYDSEIKYYGSADSLRTSKIDYIQRQLDRGYLRPVFDFEKQEYEILKILTIKVDSNITFRPPVHFSDRKIVYLTDEYKKLLDDFLGLEYFEFLGNRILRCERLEQSEPKIQFVSNAAKVSSHTFYWELITYPYAYTIVLDRGMRRAVVDFRFDHWGGYVFLEKQNGEWKIVIVNKYRWID